jgi:broad specificity phosphatase PhoE
VPAPDTELWLVRHGQTEWSREGRHTSSTDVPLTEEGVAVAKSLAERLAGERFGLVLTSPRQRARRTAELAGFPDAHVEPGLVEWDYGDYEGLTTEQIRRRVPGWTVWTHGCPGGESAEQVGRRLDRVVAKAREHGGRVLVFGHGHALRVLAARWLGQQAEDGRLYRLDTATVGSLGYEREAPVLLRWNC